MYTCIDKYVYIYWCIYISIYKQIHINICLTIFRYIYKHINMYICMYTNIYTYIHSYIFLVITKFRCFEMSECILLSISLTCFHFRQCCMIAEWWHQISSSLILQEVFRRGVQFSVLIFFDTILSSFSVKCQSFMTRCHPAVHIDQMMSDLPRWEIKSQLNQSSAHVVNF